MPTEPQSHGRTENTARAPFVVWAIVSLWSDAPRLSAAEAPQTVAPIRAVAIVAEAELVVAKLRTEPKDTLRVAAWQALFAKLTVASEAALRNPKTIPEDDAIRILKLKTYFDLLPTEPPTPDQRGAYCTTLLANACPSVENPTPADLSPEARLAFAALAAWSREDGLACFPAMEKPKERN